MIRAALLLLLLGACNAQKTQRCEFVCDECQGVAMRCSDSTEIDEPDEDAAADIPD